MAVITYLQYSPTSNCNIEDVFLIYIKQEKVHSATNVQILQPRSSEKKTQHICTIIATRKIFLSMQYDASSRSIKESVCYQVGLICPVVTVKMLSNNEVLGSRPSSTTKILSSVTLHTYRWQFTGKTSFS